MATNIKSSYSVSGIYSITHLDSGKQYVGSSEGINARWHTHVFDLNNQKHHSKYLQRSWDKHGIDAFSFELLEECPKEKLLEREQFYIDALSPVYNGIKVAARGPVGYKWSDEARQKMSEQRKGRVGYWTGKTMSEEHKKKVGDSIRGRKESEETKAKKSKALKGRSMSDDQKEKLRLAWIERKKRGFSQETRNKMRESAIARCSKEGAGRWSIR